MTSSNFKYCKKILALALIASTLAPTLVNAQSLISAELDNVLKQAESELKQQREQEAKDQSECVPQKPGAGIATSFANVISRGIQQTLSQTVNRVISQNLQSIVQRQIGQVLPQVIQQGLAQALPNAMRQRTRGWSQSQLSAQGPGVMQEEIRRLLPQIIQRDFPGALQTGIAGGLTQQLTGDFQNQILATSTTNTTFLNAPDFQAGLQGLFGITGVMAQAFDPSRMIQLAQQIIDQRMAELQDSLIQAATTGDIDSINSELQQLRSIGPTILQALIKQEITAFQTMLAGLANNIQRGMANDAANGIAKGDGMSLLVQRMMPMIMQMLLNGDPRNPQNTGLLGQMNNTSFNNAISSSGAQNSFNNFNFNDFAGNNITAAIGFDLRPVSEAIAQPLALATVSGLGVAGYDRAIGNLAISGFQGTPTISDLRFAGQLTPDGANYLGAISNVYHGPFNSGVATALNNGDINTAAGAIPGLGVLQNPALLPTSNDLVDLSAFHAANPDFVGPPSAEQIVGADAAAAVDGGNIANNTSNNFSSGLSGLGAQIGGQLQAGLVNGVSSGIGSLVDGVPYVGGLLSPIVEQVVQTALIALIGPLPLDGQIAVKDAGLNRTVGKSIQGQTKALLKPLVKVQGYEKQQVDLITKQLLPQQQVEIDRATRDCLVNKKAKNATEALVHKALVDDPAAEAGSLALYGALSLDWQKIRSAAIQSRLGPPTNGENEKQAIFIPISEVLATAAEEGRRASLGNATQNGDENTKAAATLIDRTARTTGWGAQTISQAEQKRLTSNSATAREKMDALVALNDPRNDSRAAYLKQLDETDSKIAQKVTEAVTENIAAKGYQSSGECEQWVISPPLEPWCKSWKVKTPGAVNAEMDAKLATFVLDKLVTANSYKEAELGVSMTYMLQLLGNYGLLPEDLSQSFVTPCPGLQPCDPKTGYDPSAYTSAANISYSGSNLDYLTISSNFSRGLDQAVSGGLNNVFSLADSQLSSFTSNLTSGISGARWSANDSYQQSQTMHEVITQALDQTGGIAQSDYEKIINALLQLLIKRLTGQ